MELVTGDETGLLKALRVDGGSQQQQRIGDELQSRSRGVCRLALDGASDGPERFHAALASGCVETSAACTQCAQINDRALALQTRIYSISIS